MKYLYVLSLAILLSSTGLTEFLRIVFVRAAEKIIWPEVAPDFGSATRRVDGFILVIWGH